MQIRSNMPAHNAHRNIKNTGVSKKRAAERLSSGYRINTAADDASGLAISETMRAQIRGLDQAFRNTQDGIALIQTAEGGMSEITNMIHRIRELTVQAANDTYVQNDYRSDRLMIQYEINQLLNEIDAIANRVEFNTRVLLSGVHGREALEWLSENINLISDIVEWGPIGVVDSPYHSFTFPNVAQPATVTLNLGAGIDPNGCATQLHGKSFSIGSSSFNFHYTNGHGVAFPSGGAVRALPAAGTQTVAEFLESQSGNFGSSVDSVSVNASTGAVTFTGTLGNYIGSITADGITRPHIVINGSGTGVNNTTVSSSEGANLRQVNGNIGTYNQTDDFERSSTASGSFSFVVRANYSAADIDELINSVIRVNLPDGSHHYIEFSRDGYNRNDANSSIQVYDGMDGATLQAEIINRMESIGFSVTGSGNSGSDGVSSIFTIDVDKPVPAGWNTPIDISARTWIITEEYAGHPGSPAIPAVYDPVGSATFPPMTGIVVNNTFNNTPEMPDVRDIVLPSTVPPIPSTVTIGGQLIILFDSSTFPINDRVEFAPNTTRRIDTSGLTDAQILSSLRNNVLSAAVSAFPSPNAMVTQHDGNIRIVGRDGIPLTPSPVLGSTTVNANFAVRISGPVAAVPSTPPVIGGQNVTIENVADNVIMNTSPQRLQRNISLEMQLVVDGGGNIDFTNLNGTGFTFMGQLFEFVTTGSSQINSSARAVNIDPGMSPTQVAEAMENAMRSRFMSPVGGGMNSAVNADIASTLIVTAGANGQMEINFNARTQDNIFNNVASQGFINGNWQFGGVFGNSSAQFSGGTIAEQPSTIVDFSSITREQDLMGRGFRIQCASCANEFINVIFIGSRDNLDIPIPDGFYLDPPNEDTFIRNMVVEINLMDNFPSDIASSIANQLNATGHMNHFSRVRSEGNRLIVYDIRRGDLSGSTADNITNRRPHLIPGVRTNFEYDLATADLPHHGPLWFQTGANAMQGIKVHIESMTAISLGLRTIFGRPIANVVHELGGDITPLLDTLDDSIAHVSIERAQLGAIQNRLEYTSRSLGISSENLSDAESRIRNADMAQEMMDFTQMNILFNSGMAILSQANMTPQNIIQLLQQ